MILAAYQPRSFPCLHWWNRMLESDVFVILDDLQFKRQSWQHRYEVWMHDHPHRLTIPIDHSSLFKLIIEVKTAPGSWREKHLRTLKHCYKDEPHFDRYYRLAGRALEHSLLGDINLTFITDVVRDLEIGTNVVYSSSLGIEAKATDYLVELCEKFDADTYLCGGTAYRRYMELDKFEEADIRVEVQRWFCDYLRGDISIIDPLMRHGGETLKWLK